MPAISPDRVKQVRASLRSKKVFSFDQLLSLLKCSTRSGRTKLKQWEAYTSYNQNGRYYTLPSIPRFDENGLWKYKEIRFSKHGNLKKTVVHLIRTSLAGLDGKQIGEIVGLSPNSFMHHFRNTPGIRREKQGGVYVYFSADADVYKHQTEKRLEAHPLSSQPLSDTDAIVILAALIRHHEIEVKDIMTLPEIKSAGFSHHVVYKFLEHHDLLKKTAATKY